MTIDCFFLHETDTARASLRVYSFDGACALNPRGCHIASVDTGKVPLLVKPDGCYDADGEAPDPSDPRWPASCPCGHVFGPDAVRSLRLSRLYRRGDTGGHVTLDDPPPGAMYYSDWLLSEGSGEYRGPDGHCLTVVTPGGPWLVDSRASNCTRPDDDTHKCWVRQGVPPLVTVGKTGGPTCAAGAGSILCGDYHGFLIGGRLT